MKPVLIMLTAVLYCTTAKASEHGAEEGLTIGTSLIFTQRQVLPNGHILHDGALGRISVDVEMHDWGLYTHILTQRGLDSEYNGEEQEVDAVIGITKKFLHHYRYDFNIMYDHNLRNWEDDFLRLHLKVGLDTGESRRDFRISPYVSATSYLTHSASEHMSNGTVYSLGIDNLWKITDKLIVLVPVALSYDDGLAHEKPGLVVMGSIGLQYKCSKHISFEASYTAYLGNKQVGLLSTMLTYRW